MPDSNGAVAGFWKSIALFLAGVVITLVSSYFAHGASKEDIIIALRAHQEVQNETVKGINSRLDVIQDNQQQVLRRLQALEVETAKRR